MGTGSNALDDAPGNERLDRGRGPADVWRVGAFVVAAVLWVPASAVLVFVGYVGLIGIGSEKGDTPGLLDDPKSASAIAALIVAVGALAAGLAVLIALARWSWPEHPRSATVRGVMACAWMPSLAVVVVLTQ